MPQSDLDNRLLAAHAAGDHPALIDLYLEASDSVTEPVAAGFYLTHAYVFALETCDSRALMLKAKLIEMGRDT